MTALLTAGGDRWLIREHLDVVDVLEVELVGEELVTGRDGSCPRVMATSSHV